MNKITLLMRKDLFLCAMLSVALSITHTFAARAEPIEWDNILYEVAKFAGRPTEEAVVVGFREGYDPRGELVIPPYIEYEGEKLPVVGIGWTDYSGHEADPPAINNRKGITSVRLPKEMRNIGKLEFLGCPNIERYVVEEGCEEYKVVDNSLFEKIYSSEPEERWLLFRYPSGAKAQTYVVPSIAERIHTGAFASNTSLKKIYVSLYQRLGDGWQLGNRSIEEVDCSNSRIYKTGALGAVYQGSSLIAVCPGRRYDNFIVPEFVTEIGWGAFCNSDIGNLLIHSDVKPFADKMTFMNSEVESIDYPDAVAPFDVWDNCFSGCRNLKSIKLGADASGHLDIYVGAFHGCESLEEVVFTSGISTMKIDLCAFMGCSSLKSFPITSDMKIKKLEEKAFSGCRSLESFLFSTVEEFSEYGYQFEGSGLKNVHWPSAFKNMPRGIFMNCKALEKVDLKTTTKRLYWDAFRGSGISALNMAGVDDWYISTFDDCPNLSRLYFPDYGDNEVRYNAVRFIPENSQVVVNHSRIRNLDDQTSRYSDKAALYLSPVEGGMEIGNGWRKVLVPGRADHLYKAITSSDVEEMFSYTTFPEKKAVEVKSLLPEVRITSVVIEGVEATLSGGLYVAEDARVGTDRMNVAVNYKVSNCPMTSIYSYLYSGVDATFPDGQDPPVEWYTLDGIRVSRGGLAPGIYVRKQGTHAEKMIIR